jgi:thiosulfate reductase cytochrome b subunit
MESSFPIVGQEFFFAETCLPSCFLATRIHVTILCTILLFLLLLQFWSIGLISQFLDHFTDGRSPWTGDQLVARQLPKHRTTQTQENAHAHTPKSMPRVRFEPTIPASARAKTVHAVNRSAAVTDYVEYTAH